MLNDHDYPQETGPHFDRFFRDHRSALERFIRIRIGATGDAEDIAAEVMCQLIEYCRRNPERAILHRALMFKIARGRIADHFDRRAKKQEIPIEDAPQIPAPGSIPESIDADDELRRVRAVLETIREEYREVITLHAMVGLSASEIADMMEKPQAHVRVLIFRARRSLRKALRKQYPDRYDETDVEQS